ncbi:MAG: recombinase family protein [Anaerolineales bacterium]|nr:recombinase family protein [Anaerolineales bacterium]
MNLPRPCLAVVIYLRVSSEKQATEYRVSIEEQLAKCKQLCEQQGFKIVAVFVDKERYKKAKAPNKGKVVEPSGKWDDRPGFLAMLERVEPGDIDAVIAFDISRLGRHFRVLGTMANSLDIANGKRRSEVQIWEASKNSTVTRMMLGIMITVAQEENEARVNRVNMGKIGKLKRGYWPGPYQRLGYKLLKDKYGTRIDLEPEETKTVQLIYDLADSNHSTYAIRRKLVAIGAKQKGHRARLRDWSEAMITSILRCPDYMGETVWKFDDGEQYPIKIPQIIKPQQWHRVQKGIEERKKKCLRNTKVTWAALQHILVCGECGGKMYLSVKRYYSQTIDGQRIRCEYQIPLYSYRCAQARRYPGTHTKNSLSGPGIDYQIWRYLIDNAVKNPELIRERVEARQQELLEQGNGVMSEIVRAERENLTR